MYLTKEVCRQVGRQGLILAVAEDWHYGVCRRADCPFLSVPRQDQGIVYLNSAFA